MAAAEEKIEVTWDTASEIVLAMASAHQPEPRTVTLIGIPGCGKSALAYAAGRASGRTVTEVRAPVLSELDVHGFPHLVKDRYRFVPMDCFPRDNGGVFLLEEIGQATTGVMSALMALVYQPFRLDSYEIPTDTLIILTANESDQLAGSQDRTSTLVSRGLTLYLAADTDAVARHLATLPDCDSTVAAWLAYTPDMLSRSDLMENAWRDAQPFLCARTAELMARALHAHPTLSPAARRALCAGYVGATRADEYLAFAQVRSELPALSALFAGDKQALAACAGLSLGAGLILAAAIAGQVRAGNLTVQAVKRCVAALPDEIGARVVRDVLVVQPTWAAALA